MTAEQLGAMREAFLGACNRGAAGTPPKSLAEMEALAAPPNVRAVRLSAGKLAVHEKFPDAVAEVVNPFLRDSGA